MWISVFCLCSVLPDVASGTAVQTPSPEPRDDPPSCFSCSETSQIEASETVRITLLHLSELEVKLNICLTVEGLWSFVRWPELWSFLLLQQPHRWTHGLVGHSQSPVLVLFCRWVAQTEPRTMPEWALTVLSCCVASRCWHLDWERAGGVSEDPWTAGDQSGSRCDRNQRKGKRQPSIHRRITEMDESLPHKVQRWSSAWYQGPALKIAPSVTLTVNRDVWSCFLGLKNTCYFQR